MIHLEIKEADWKELKDAETVQDKPYWAKLPNNNIVMVAYVKGYASGWAKVFIDESGDLTINHNVFYMLRDSKIQEVVKES